MGKHAIQTVYNRDSLSHTRELFIEGEILDLYQVIFGKILLLCNKLTQMRSSRFFSKNLKSPLVITQKMSLELIIVHVFFKKMATLFFDPASDLFTLS